jgi:hypothetical protein
MSGETTMRPAKFDELCDKLADKYGENPESVWRDTVGEEAADDTDDVDWCAHAVPARVEESERVGLLLLLQSSF